MDEQDWLAQRFEEHRSHLRAVAYRMLGSLSEADDAVQEAWLRLSRSETSGVENLGGWLTRVVGRVCLDMLRSRISRRVMPLGEPLGTRLPEPLVSRADGIDPEHEALLADSVGLALLVVLETLTPAERLAHVLHDMFSVPFDQVGATLERSPEAARQLASRRLAERRPRREARACQRRPRLGLSARRRTLRDRRPHGAQRADHDHGHPSRPPTPAPPGHHRLPLPTMRRGSNRPNCPSRPAQSASATSARRAAS